MPNKVEVKVHINQHGLSGPSQRWWRRQSYDLAVECGRVRGACSVCRDHNFRESEVKLLKPMNRAWQRWMLSRRKQMFSCDIAPKTVLAIRVGALGHITTAHVTPHFATRKSHVLCKLHTHLCVVWIGTWGTSC